MRLEILKCYSKSAPLNLNGLRILQGFRMIMRCSILFNNILVPSLMVHGHTSNSTNLPRVPSH